MVFVGGEVDLGDVGVGEDAGFAKEEVASSGGSETSFFGEAGGEDVDREGAAKFGDVSVGVPTKREQSVKQSKGLDRKPT